LVQKLFGSESVWFRSCLVQNLFGSEAVWLPNACLWLSSSVVLWMHNCASFWQIVFTTRLPSFMTSTWHFHALGVVFGEVYDSGSVLDCWKILGLIIFPRFLCPGSLFGLASLLEALVLFSMV
jgi:hypothetical protein